MKKNGKHIEDLLKQDMLNTEIPEGLRKDKIVEMLKEQRDFSDKTGNVIDIGAARDTAPKRGISAAVIQRVATAAAAVAIIIVSVLFARVNTDVKIIGTEPMFGNYNSENLIIKVSSYDEIEQAVQNALQKDKANISAESPSGNSDSTQVENVSLGQISNAFVIDDSVVLETAVSAYQAGGDLVETVTGLKADIVKSNGEYLFVAGSGMLKEEKAETVTVIKALPAEEMAVVSTIVLSDNNSSNSIDECIEIYLKDNKLIAVMGRDSYVMEDKAAYGKSSTAVLYYDISNPDEPQKIREHIQDGKYIVSGITESGGLYLITEKAVAAAQTESIPVYTVDGNQTKPLAEDIFMAVNDPEAAFTFITVTDIGDFSKPVDCLAFFGSISGRLYISGDSVMISRSFISVEPDENGVHANLTEIYRFDISKSTVTFAGSYAVNGFLPGNPVVDEKTGWLTVVATDAESTRLYVLDEKMEFVSGLDGIFPGEKIKSTKFYGKNCYIISGGNGETTMIISLADLKNPQKTTVVSTSGLNDRLFSAGDEMAIRIGGKNQGDILKDINIALLDMSDPSNPGSLDLYNLSDFSNGISLIDNNGIMIMQDEKILGIPVMRKDAANKEAVLAYALFEFANGKIEPVGCFNHETKVDGATAVRGTCIGDVFYSITGNKIVAFSISEETRIASIELSGS